MAKHGTGAVMTPDLLDGITERLAAYKFKKSPNGKWWERGVCPACGERELFTRADAPWVLVCNRRKECQYEGHAKELWPDLFADWSTRARKQAQAQPHLPPNPFAAADLYLQEGRGFDLDLLKKNDKGETGERWYSQEYFVDEDTKEGTATVRFPYANGYWQRLIDRPERFKGAKARFKPGTSIQGRWWVPPSVILSQAKEIWIVEGIFDAIALLHHGKVAVATMSTTIYPETALKELEKARAQHGKDNVLLVWALDSDEAGQKYLLKHINMARRDGWACIAAQVPQTSETRLDWNDLHQRGKLEPDNFAEYLYQGKLLTAKSPQEKAILIYNHDQKGAEFPFTFDRMLWWFKVELDVLETKKKELAKLERNADATPEDIRQQALEQCAKVHSISTVLPTPLYFQRNQITDESWYYFRIDSPDLPTIKGTFTAAQLKSASSFEERLLHVARGAMFEGTTAMLKRFLKPFFKRIRSVETIDYIGYSKEYQAYVLGDLAIKDGSLVKVNKEDYFELPGKLMLKSLNQSVTLLINHNTKEHNTEWPDLLWEAFGVKGYVALSYWFGALFAEQIRENDKSLAFLEVVGEAGAGKSTLIEFLWKLCGRRDYEGFDPSKSSLAARARNFAQVANLPVVLIESDRERMGNDKSPHVKGFDWDELKTAYNGRSVRARGMATSGNETYEPPFRGAIVISQNNPVTASDAVMQRICHLFFDRAEQNSHTREAAIELERMPIKDVSNFIVRAALTEAQTMKTLRTRTPFYERKMLQGGNVRSSRLAKNHAQLMAMAEALAPVIRMTKERLDDVLDFIEDMAIERQQTINADTPVVQEFWEMVNFIEGKSDISNGMFWLLNHSRDAQEIAINLNHFYAKAREANQVPPSISDLKKSLKGSRRYKYKRQATVNSKITEKTTYCWIFENPRGA